MTKKNNPHSSRHWMFVGAAAATLGMVSACGGGDDGAAPAPAPTPAPAPAPAPPPAEALTLSTRLGADLGRAMMMLGSIEGGGVVMLTPGMPLAPNVTTALDSSAGTPANTWTFRGKYDGDGGGNEETTVDGRFRFVNDATDFAAGFAGGQGSATLTVDLLSLMLVYRGDFAFTLGMTEHRVSGGGTLTDPITGVATTLAVDAAAPLGIKLADGSAGARANACAHSLNGTAQFSQAGSGGTLASQWSFAYDRSTASVSGATYTDRTGQRFTLPDSEIDLGCGGPGSINDWNGRFRIRWACLPQEFGEFNTTITVKNATTISMIDDGDTASDAYEAVVIGSSARALRGFFVDGPVGNRYREDFNWTLASGNNGFTQSSRYVYVEGPSVGKGGICAARATRIS